MDRDITANRSWWNQSCGGREILSVALPMVVSTLSFVVMQFFDRLFLTWYSNEDLAAVVPAGALSWTATSFPLGIAMYANTFVAQYEGARAPKKIGEIVWQAIWIGVMFTPLFLVAGYYSKGLFSWIGHSDELVWREAAYFKALCFGSTAVVMSEAVSAFYVGRGKTITIMLVSFVAAAVNILLDYLMIFGVHAGGATWLPAGGIAGAGWATTISLWLKFAILMTLLLSAKNRLKFNSFYLRLAPSSLGRLLKYGVPSGFQFVIEGGAVTVFILIIARISDVASAATALAFSINMIVFVPISGLGIAVTTLVGQQMGEQRPDLAAKATWSALWLGLPYTIAFGFACFFVPGWFFVAHNLGTVEFAEVQELAVVLLMFVAVYCLFDTIQLIFVSAIKGAGDTYFVVFFTILSSTVFLLVGVLGARRFADPQWQIHWWWACLTVWIFALGLAYYLRFQQGKWRTMNLIGPDLVKSMESTTA